MAAATGHVEVLTLLIASGARPDGGDHHETPPLVDAAEGGRVDAIRALVKHGARAKLDDALGMACDRGHAGAARALIEAGADPNGRGHWGATPLIYAAGSTRRSLDVLKLLLDSGAEVDAVDDSGETALFQAAWSSWNYGPQWPQTVAAATPVIQMLLAAGADPAIKNNKGLSVLDRLAAQPEPGAAGMLAVIKEGVERRAVKKP